MRSQRSPEPYIATRRNPNAPVDVVIEVPGEDCGEVLAERADRHAQVEVELVPLAAAAAAAAASEEDQLASGAAAIARILQPPPWVSYFELQIDQRFHLYRVSGGGKLDPRRRRRGRGRRPSTGAVEETGRCGSGEERSHRLLFFPPLSL